MTARDALRRHNPIGWGRRRAPAWITYDDSTVRPWGEVSDDDAGALDASHIVVTADRGRPAWLSKEVGDA